MEWASSGLNIIQCAQYPVGSTSGGLSMLSSRATTQHFLQSGLMGRHLMSQTLYTKTLSAISQFNKGRASSWRRVDILCGNSLARTKPLLPESIQLEFQGHEEKGNGQVRDPTPGSPPRYPWRKLLALLLRLFVVKQFLIKPSRP